MSVRQVTGPLRRITGDAVAQAIRRRRIIRLWRRSINIVRTVVAIVGNGGEESQCGWCKDRFGLSWQIVPRALQEAFTDPDTAAAKRAMEAKMTMKKIDIATIEAARAG